MREIKATCPSGLENLGGYSDVLTVRGGARTIYVAGQTAWSVAHRGPDRLSLQTQTVECFDNVKRCLETAGASFDDVLKLTIFVVGRNARSRFGIARTSTAASLKVLPVSDRSPPARIWPRWAMR